VGALAPVAQARARRRSGVKALEAQMRVLVGHSGWVTCGHLSLIVGDEAQGTISVP
jgi:hypothetical protein